MNNASDYRMRDNEIRTLVMQSSYCPAIFSCCEEDDERRGEQEAESLCSCSYSCSPFACVSSVCPSQQALKCLECRGRAARATSCSCRLGPSQHQHPERVRAARASDEARPRPHHCLIGLLRCVVENERSACTSSGCGSGWSDLATYETVSVHYNTHAFKI